jgi:hypothetical protein
MLWLWGKALGANPYGWAFGTIAGIVIGAFLAQYLLARTLNAVWLATMALVAAALGGYVLAIAGGFLTCWIMRLVSHLR